MINKIGEKEAAFLGRHKNDRVFFQALPSPQNTRLASSWYFAVAPFSEYALINGMAEDFDKTRGDIPAPEPEGSQNRTAPRGGAAYPCFEIVAGPQEGLLIPLNAGEQVLGRSQAEAALYLQDTSISRRHAKIINEKGQVVLQDLGSRNGTQVNGRRLKEDEKAVLNHGDKIRAGIYVLRFLTGPNVEEKKPAPAPPSPPKTESKLEPPAPEKEIKDVVQFEEGGEEPVKEQNRLPAETPAGLRFGGIFLGICLLSGILGLTYLFVTQRGKKEAVKVVEPLPLSPVPTPAEPQEVTVIVPPVPSTPARSSPVFLDIQSPLLPAHVSFDEKYLGVTPLKTPLDLVRGQEYTLTAEYDLRDAKDKYQFKKTFTAPPGVEVVTVTLEPEIGSIVIKQLPRSADFYLEGYYAYDKLKASPVKLINPTYGSTIFLPYGHYTIEMKEKNRVGDSDTFINATLYHREFDLSGDVKKMVVDVTEKDLAFFPAVIHTNPAGADLLVDGQKVGTTPYEGPLPLGRHEFKIVKSGFFDTPLVLEMPTNVPYETTIDLKTSRAGELINKADELAKAGLNQEAINNLVEALKLDISPQEKARAHLLLGHLYLGTGNTDSALIYFEQAKAVPEFYSKALLGVAKCQEATGDPKGSLTTLVEIFLNVSADDPVKSEAANLFKKLSPFQSVIYVATDPPGASVVVNNKEVDQKTPLILTDMDLGLYRLIISKPGFVTEQVKRNLNLSEFVPFMIKLKPEVP